MHDVLLWGVAVDRMADIAQKNRHAAHGLDRQIVEVCYRFRRVVELDNILVGADFHVAGRNNQGLVADRGLHVLGGQIVGLQCLGIEFQQHFACFAAVWRGRGGAAHGRQARAYGVFIPRSSNCCSDSPLPE